MKAVLQRVSFARVSANGVLSGTCGRGLLVLLGAVSGDGEAECEFMAEKISKLRIFPNEVGKLDLSVKDIGGEILAVSNFTLAASCRKGNRPDFSSASPYDRANTLFDIFVSELRKKGINVETGVFGADMKVELCNDGPVTVILDTSEIMAKK